MKVLSNCHNYNGPEFRKEGRIVRPFYFTAAQRREGMVMGAPDPEPIKSDITEPKVPRVKVLVEKGYTIKPLMWTAEEKRKLAAIYHSPCERHGHRTSGTSIRFNSIRG